MASTTAAPPPAAAADVPSHRAPVSTKASQLKTNLSYLVKGPIKGGPSPSSLTTRSTLRTVRYVAKFVFWRLIRYFKYAFVAAGVAAVGTGVLGATLPWVAAIAVPSMPVAAAMGLTTAAIKFGWRHRGNHFRQAWLVGGEGRDARKDEEADANEAAANGPLKETMHPRAGHAWAGEGFS